MSQAACAYVCRTKVSPRLPPTPPSAPPPRPKKNHTVIRRQCYETFQASCNVPSTSSKCAIFDKLQQKIRSIASRPAQKVTGKSSEQSIKSVSQAARESSEFSITRCYECVVNSYHPNHTVIRQCAYVCWTKVSCAHFLSCPLTDPPHFVSFLFVSCVRPGCLTRDLVG